MPSSSLTTRHLLGHVAWPLFGVVVVLAVLDGLDPLYPLDLHLIAAAGDRLLSSDWRSTFADAIVQVGPLQAALWAIVLSAADLVGIPHQVAFSVFAQTSVVGGTVFLVRLLQPKPRVNVLVLLAGVTLLLVWGVPWRAYLSGHPEEVWIGVLWVIVAVQASTGRPLPAGLVLGLASCLKPWGILGMPLLLLGDRRDALRSGVTSSLVTLVAYGPFFLFGTVNALEYTWPITSTSVLSVFGIAGKFSWSMRAAQAIFVVLVGGVLAITQRHRSFAVWLVPLQMVAARLLLDPINVQYYWMPVLVISCAGTIASWNSLPIVSRVTLALLLYLLVLSLASAWPGLWWAPFTLVVGVSWVLNSSSTTET